MKNTKMSPVRFRIITLVTLFLISVLSCAIFSLTPGKDYTHDYLTYSEVKGITSTYELMDFCHENDIDYSINSRHFTMKTHSFTFSVNKSDCSINNNSHMNNFYLLESGRYDVFVEEENIYKLNTWGTNYELCDGTYTLYNMWPALISLFFAIIIAIITCMYMYLITTCKRCKHKNTSD